MENKFQKLSIIVKKLKKMPINYKNFRGKEFMTFCTTQGMLQNIMFNLGSDNTIQRDYEYIKDMPLGELGFKSRVLYIDNLTGKAIAIFGV